MRRFFKFGAGRFRDSVKQRCAPGGPAGPRLGGSTTTRVFAGVSGIDRLPPELLYRLVTFDFKPCTREEFLEVTQEGITGQLGKDPSLAHYAVEREVLRTTDIHQPSRWPSSATHRKRWAGMFTGCRELRWSVNERPLRPSGPSTCDSLQTAEISGY